ncbi:hypothetical protein fugu_015898 [Takifugu bimaculatus]|uniref:Uncharacterized protein n=1 Tax=Takifugu bimaculatus TaxID=433685 RepID=A0A4Z2BWK1_9TELE|nr:hypothetical protein fugu_015898 [Takifugu bimaculatus]
MNIFTSGNKLTGVPPATQASSQLSTLWLSISASPAPMNMKSMRGASIDQMSASCLRLSQILFYRKHQQHPAEPHFKHIIIKFIPLLLLEMVVHLPRLSLACS